VCLDLLGVYLLDDVCRVPGLERKALGVVAKVLDFLNFFVSNDGFDLGVRVMNDQLLDSLVRDLALLFLETGLGTGVGGCAELVRCLAQFVCRLRLGLVRILLEESIFYKEIQVLF